MFNPNEHLTQLQGKDYLEVKWRLVWFREQCPGGTIDTEELEYDAERPVEAEVFVWNQEKRRKEKVVKQSKGYARYRAVVTDGNGARATGTKSENAANFPDFGEKAETGAIGRALAALGYGTQFTGDEFYEGERIVDSPVDRSSQSRNGGDAEIEESKVTEQQLSSIHKLCERLGKSEPEHVTTMGYLDAKKLINQLTAEYRESKSAPQEGKPTLAEVIALCEAVYGPGKWPAAKAKAFNPEQYGDIPDEMLSQKQRQRAYSMIDAYRLEKQKATTAKTQERGANS